MQRNGFHKTMNQSFPAFLVLHNLTPQKQSQHVYLILSIPNTPLGIASMSFRRFMFLRVVVTHWRKLYSDVELMGMYKSLQIFLQKSA